MCVCEKETDIERKREIEREKRGEKERGRERTFSYGFMHTCVLMISHFGSGNMYILFVSFLFVTFTFPDSVLIFGCFYLCDTHTQCTIFVCLSVS